MSDVSSSFNSCGTSGHQKCHLIPTCGSKHFYICCSLFLKKILFFQPILFHIYLLLQKSTVFCERAVLFDWGLAKKATCWSAWFLLVSWYPEIYHVCFALSVCFTCDLAHFKKIFPGFARDWCHFPCERFKKFYLPDCFVSWAQHLGWSDVPEPKDSNFLNPVGWKRNKCWPLRNFSSVSRCEILNSLWSSLVCHLSIPHHLPSQATIPTDEIIYAGKNLRAIIWLVRTNKRTFKCPAVLLIRGVLAHFLNSSW